MDRSAAYPLLRRTGGGLALTTCAAVLLAGCGSPPKPLPTAPPRASVSLSAAPSVSLPPEVPSLPPVLPTGVVPPAALPTYPVPPTGLPTYPTTTGPTPTPTRTTTPPPAPAPACTAGPTDEQILAVLRGRPGVPTGQELKIDEGPFCAGEWQYATVALVGVADAEPLLAVTRGKPASLQLVEAGTDVCSDPVQSGAPPGIRVLACGS